MSRKSKDGMRTNMIVHFHCAECGKQLTLTDGDGKHYNRAYSQIPQEPTGAECYYVPRVNIWPCESCINKYTGPAKKILEGLKEMEK